MGSQLLVPSPLRLRRRLRSLIGGYDSSVDSSLSRASSCRSLGKSQPPVRKERASKVGKWEEREIKVSETSWDVNSLDIAVAGLGWFSIGLKGEATLSLWTYNGIEVTSREPLVPDRAPFLERPGKGLEDIGAMTESADLLKSLNVERQ
ncbi:hypothetical protein BT93_L1031 [Corymbia citriodora subsp. variegata]|uniref:Uncharacterized protein n=1 Tax=Corymbia citriodora subsp. variegata TaxID=360336 RepID=A0A8T0CNN1_CORYI|nr:hypothetical protein BT93_L1031 [Corymbia citriodora subsp. variegata]